MSSNRNDQAQKEIAELMKTRFPDLYLANLEIWDEEGYSKHKTKLKYKDWIKRRKCLRLE